MKYIFITIIFIVSIFSFADANFDDPIVSTFDEVIDYQFMIKIKNEKGHFAAMRNTANRKVYLTKISQKCFNEKVKSGTGRYKFTHKHWTKKSGKTGYELIKEESEFCSQNSSLSKKV